MISLTDKEFITIMEYLDRTTLEDERPMLWLILDKHWMKLTEEQLESKSYNIENPGLKMASDKADQQLKWLNDNLKIKD